MRQVTDDALRPESRRHRRKPRDGRGRPAVSARPAL